MTRRIVLLTFLLAAAMITHAQEFEKGTNVASLGIGVGSSILHYSGASQSPGLSLQYEKGMWDIGGPGVISLGGYVGYKSYKYTGKYAGGYEYNEKWRYTVIGVRSAYHYTGLDVDKLDVYGGVMLSYNILKYTYTDNGPSGTYYNSGSYGNTTGFSLYVGGRYYLNDNLAVLAELGYGVSYLNIGVALRF
jgi:hypothetical protein